MGFFVCFVLFSGFLCSFQLEKERIFTFFMFFFSLFPKCFNSESKFHSNTAPSFCPDSHIYITNMLCMSKMNYSAFWFTGFHLNVVISRACGCMGLLGLWIFMLRLDWTNVY